MQWREFVADPAQSSRHNRGCAVDLTLYDLRTGAAVQMPSVYDEMSERSYPSYAGRTREQRRLRDLLRATMEREGFAVYPDRFQRRWQGSSGLRAPRHQHGSVVSLEVVDADDASRVLAAFSQADLERMMRQASEKTMLGTQKAGVAFVWVTFDRLQDAPAQLSNRFKVKMGDYPETIDVQTRALAVARIL